MGVRKFVFALTLLLLLLPANLLLAMPTESTTDLLDAYLVAHTRYHTLTSFIKQDEFREEGKALGAEIYILRLTYGGIESERKVEIKKIVFKTSIIKGIEEQEIENIELVVDKNKNGKADPEEPRVGGKGKIDFTEKEIRFEESFVHQGGETLYILRADFLLLEKGDVFTVELNGQKIIEGRDLDTEKKVTTSDSTNLVSYHIEGSVVPELIWADQWQKKPPFDEKAYTWDGVDPDQGQSLDEFRFAVVYQDLDGEEPKISQVWIDINGDSQYQDSEKFEMKLTTAYSLDYREGEEYETKIRLATTASEPTIKYRFYFVDSDGNEARGMAAEEREMSIAPMIQAYVFSEEGKDKFIDGMFFPINLGFVHYIGVNLTEDFEKLDLSPFKVEKVILGPRLPAKKPDQDYQVVTLILTLEEGKPVGVYQIPLVDIHYTCTYAAQGQRVVLEGIIKTKPLPGKKHQVEKLPIVFKQSLTPETITLGDKFTRTISIFHEPDRTILAEEYLENLDPKNSFAPFEILVKKTHQENVASIKLAEISFELTLYRLPPEDKESFKLKLSSLKIPYLDEKGKRQELLIPGVTVYLNTVVKDDQAPPKLFLGPEGFRKYDWKTSFKVGAGLILLFVSLVLGLQVKRLIIKHKEGKSTQPLFEAEEKVKDTIQTCKNLRELAKLEQSQIAQLFIDFKVYLGHLIYQKSLQRLIEPQQAKNKTVEELVEFLEKIDYFSLDRLLIKEILVIFNGLVYGEFNRTEAEILIEKMERFFI